MLKKHINILISAIAIFLSFTFALAQDQTVGLFQNDSWAFSGYTLFAPTAYNVTYLIDMQGRLVHSWQSDSLPGQSSYLLENGNLLRTLHLSGISVGVGGGGFEVLAWDGTVVWKYEYLSDHYTSHHDIEPLPNNNILLLAWETKTKEDVIGAGRNPDNVTDQGLRPEHIIEVEQTGPTTGNIVWEWHAWDHLVQDYDSTKANYGVVADHPELIDINFPQNDQFQDWLHGNWIAYNPELDQIMLSICHFNELWVIDHSTTTEEAAGHSGGSSGMGGDILYRWGNPQVYDAGTSDEQVFYSQHNTHWIKPGLPGEGNIILFNNGVDRPEGDYSSIDELAPPVDSSGHYLQPDPGTPFGPSKLEWSYIAGPPTDFFAERRSSCQRCANGNTLICSSPNGTFFEVTPDGKTVWRYVNPVNGQGPVTQGDPPGKNGVFNCSRYTADYPGLKDKDLTPGDPIEIDPIEIVNHTSYPENYIKLQNFPNPFKRTTNIRFNNPGKNALVKIYSSAGKEIVSEKVTRNNFTWNAENQPSGLYFVKVIIHNRSYEKHICLIK